VGEFHAAGDDVKEGGVRAGDGGFGVRVILSKAEREAEGEEEGNDGSWMHGAEISSRLLYRPGLQGIRMVSEIEGV
jgi:hypothetical protein